MLTTIVIDYPSGQNEEAFMRKLVDLCSRENVHTTDLTRHGDISRHLWMQKQEPEVVGQIPLT